MLEVQIRQHGGCIVNYDMQTLGQDGCCGHFSLVVGIATLAAPETSTGTSPSTPTGTQSTTAATACAEEGGCGVSVRADEEQWVLLLDTWPETPCCWVPLRYEMLWS